MIEPLLIISLAVNIVLVILAVTQAARIGTQKHRISQLKDIVEKVKWDRDTWRDKANVI